MAEKEEKNIRIVKAQEKDIALVVSLRKLLFQEMGVPEESFIENVYDVIETYYAEELSGDNIAHYIAYDGDKPVAVAGALIKTDFPYYLFNPGYYGWIIDVYTVTEYRGRGLASELIDKAHQWLREKGVTESKLIASGSKARKLYDRLGYRATWEMSYNLSGLPTYNEYIDQNGDGEGI